MLRHITALRLARPARTARYLNRTARRLCTESTEDSVAEANRARVREYLSSFGTSHGAEATPSGGAEAHTRWAARPLKKHIPVTKDGPTADELSDLLGEHGARDVVKVDVRSTAPFADWLVIATAHAGPHVSAVANGLCAELRQRGVSVGGELVAVVDRASPDWQIVDVGPVVVHVLSEEARELYGLETLWSEDGDPPDASHEGAHEVIMFDQPAPQRVDGPPERAVMVEGQDRDSLNGSETDKASATEAADARAP